MPTTIRSRRHELERTSRRQQKCPYRRLGRIASDTITAMARRPTGAVTISTIAERAGVSKVAVSYALNGRPGVSEETRERILRIADEIGWTPNTAARALSGARTDTVGLILSRATHTLAREPFFMEFVAGVESALGRESIGLMLQVVPDIDTEIDSYRKWARSRKVDGVILTDMRVDDPRPWVLESLELPGVIASSVPLASELLSCTWIDESGAMATAIGHLLELGHTRIARVAGRPDFTRTVLRNERMREQMSNLGLPDPTIITTDCSGGEGAVATRMLLRLPEPPTAVIFDNDLMAVAGIEVATEMGIAVPERLSVLAWDDTILCQLARPTITTLDRHLEDFGRRVGEHLLRRISGGAPEIIEEPPALLLARDSTTFAPRKP
jgi:DNA-binding LacI/PurR family transcriptional regulator